MLLTESNDTFGCLARRSLKIVIEYPSMYDFSCIILNYKSCQLEKGLRISLLLLL